MICKEIMVITDTEGAELVSDAFFIIGCNGVKIDDKNDIKQLTNDKDNLYWDYIEENLLCTEDDKSVKVSGFVSQELLEEKLEELKSVLNDYGLSVKISVADCDIDWYQNWKKYYKPLEAGRYIIIPEWQKGQVRSEKIKIYINPGMAFGTGEHQSTRLCLKLMSELDFTGKRALDIGCGSGILGIAAIKSNARSCHMCDIDSVAVEAAKQNALINGVQDCVIIENADWTKNNADIKADIILANLTADILINISQAVADKHIAEGGYLICSGIIKGKSKQVKECFEPKGFIIEKNLEEEGWSALLMRKSNGL